MTDVRDLLPLYALGLADEAERRAVEAALAADPALARELASYDDAAQAIAAAAPAVRPSAHVKARLLASAGAGRFERFLAPFAKMFDVGVEAARELLGWIEDPTKWKPSGLPGIQAIHFPGGPAVAGADTGFLELHPGALFPWHEHIGEELSLVLQGTIRDHDGTLYGPGQEIPKAGGTRHEFTAEPGDTVVVAVRAFGVKYGLVRPADDE